MPAAAAYALPRHAGTGPLFVFFAKATPHGHASSCPRTGGGNGAPLLVAFAAQAPTPPEPAKTEVIRRRVKDASSGDAASVPAAPAEGGGVKDRPHACRRGHRRVSASAAKYGQVLARHRVSGAIWRSSARSLRESSTSPPPSTKLQHDLRAPNSLSNPRGPTHRIISKPKIA